MKKLIAKAGLFSLLLTLMTGAHGAEEPFWGIGQSMYTLEADNSSGNNLEFDMDGFRFTLGSKLSNYFGLETRIVFPGHGDGDGGISLNPKFIGSILANLHLPVGPVSVYLNGGYSVAEFEIQFSDMTFDEEGLSYGAGATIDLLDNLAIYADVTTYLDKDEFNLNSVSAGIRFLIN